MAQLDLPEVEDCPFGRTIGEPLVYSPANVRSRKETAVSGPLFRSQPMTWYRMIVMVSRHRPVCLSLLVLVGVLLCPRGTQALNMTAPQEGATLRSGQQVEVRVDIGDQAGVRQVEYYWYRQGEEPLGRQQAEPALVASSSATPPYGGLLTVPVQAMGRMRLLAIGQIVKGRLGQQEEEFDEILVQVDPQADLLRIEFEAVKPWRLDTLGKILDIPVVGQFSDGVVRRLNGATAGSTYRSSDEDVLHVFPDGFVRVMGNGKAFLTVVNRGKQGTLQVVVKAEVEPNHPPTADAGPDATVKTGSRVVLSALQSLDPDGDPLRYEWTQVRGIKVSLLDQNTVRATFVAPKVSGKRLLQFKLRVTDMKGPDTVKGADSLPAFINVWVEP